MSTVFELLQAGSTVTGSTWYMINNLGGGSSTVFQYPLLGSIKRHSYSATITKENNLKGQILENKLTGKINNTIIINGVLSENEIKGSF